MKLETREIEIKNLKPLFYFYHAELVIFLNIYPKQKQEVQKWNSLYYLNGM